MKRFVRLIAILTIAFVVACAPKNSITLAKYNQIQTGMSKSQVEGILGAGTELSRVELPGSPSTVMYGWSNPDGSNVNVMFQDDRVTTKAQAGLK